MVQDEGEVGAGEEAGGGDLEAAADQEESEVVCGLPLGCLKGMRLEVEELQSSSFHSSQEG